MKHIILALAVVAMALSSCGQNDKKTKSETETQTQTQEKQEMKTLVAYFSASGVTRGIAEKLAKVTNATLYEIKPEVLYTDADLDWTNKQSRSSVEMADPDSRPAFVTDLENAADYDCIFIGFPIWWYTAPTIINTFLDTYDFSGKTVIFFATSGGSSLDKANAQFREQYPNLNWIDGKTLNGASEADIKAWVETLR